MGILDQVMQMKSQGASDSQVVNQLQQQGVSPKEIQDALAQAQVKSAVAGTNNQDMQESIMEQPQENYSQESQEYYPQEQYPQEPYQEDYSPQEQYPEQYPQETYSEYDYPETDTTNLIEIAEQIFLDKSKKITNNLEKLNEFKALIETKLKLLEDRLRRIESTIDHLQISVIDKIGSYGQNINSIKKEMSMMQDSFSKAINPLLDKKRK